MRQFYSLKKSGDFQSVYRNGRSLANRYLVVYVKKRDDDGENRVGISVSKKVGNSVVRHRIKRLLRESYRLQEAMFNSGLDIVIVARQGAASVDYFKIEEALLQLGRRHCLLRGQ